MTRSTAESSVPVQRSETSGSKPVLLSEEDLTAAQPSLRRWKSAGSRPTTPAGLHGLEDAVV